MKSSIQIFEKKTVQNTLKKCLWIFSQIDNDFCNFLHFNIGLMFGKILVYVNPY